MKGIVTALAHSGVRVVIQTEDGDFAIAHVPGAELELNDLVDGDLINPGRCYLARSSTPPVEIFLEGCRMSMSTAGDLLDKVFA